MSLLEKRSGVDGEDDEIADIKEFRLELGTMEFDAMERLSADGVCEAQEQGNSEVLVEVNDADTNENREIDDDPNDDSSTKNSGHDPGQDFGIQSDTDGWREESYHEIWRHEDTKTHVLDASVGPIINHDSDMGVDEHDYEVSLTEHEESEEKESPHDCRSDYSDIFSRSEMDNPRFVRWPIEYPQVPDESIESKKERNTATAEVLNPNLCKFCRVFFDAWSSVCDFFFNSDSYRILFSAHFGTMSDFKASASGGCYLCALFLGIIYSDRDHSDSCAHEAGSHLPLDQLKPYRIKLQPNGDHRDDNQRERENAWNLSLDFWVCKDGIRSTSTAYAIMILDDISDPGTWKRQCYTSTELGQNNQDKFRLGCTEESTALAQKWLQECSSSHSACRQGEEASVLPTRLIKIDRQKIRLWKGRSITTPKGQSTSFFGKDSIWQTGDPEDWSKEASRMASVYGLSSLNIAATAAPDGTIGCLFERDLKYTEMHKAEVNMNHRKRVYQIADYNLYRQNIANAALTRRAWAVQERILAPRTLHFTKSQLFWECRTNQACETFDDTLPEAVCDDYFYLPKQKLQSWSKIIDIYTWCSLTNESDRLIAIGGVARQLQKNNGGKYFAGLWQARLKDQMCWYIDRFITKTPKENTWRAPSWSWASVKHKVVIHDDTTVLHEACIDVVEVDITLEDVDDPFGGVKSGDLVLRSKTMIFCERKSPLHRFTRMSVGKISIEPTNINWDHEDCGSKGHCNSILILPIGILKDAGANSDFSRIDGLLLTHIKKKGGQYERIGHFTIIKGDTYYELICRAMNLAQDEQFKALGLGDALPSEKDYISTDVDEDGMTWYTISIV
ncbi:hypothetical protein BOTNAR_0049g00120 [Botryotinia narcissicola]|uniref:Heterokaryon incompatibility domain-containing protein n=1 Tax=Botryotinia narcissicola TaxID=278944 RepID=A0A4Z1J034_9HELO|nr:hypothetical protein BOTNAR_0049g00120 [Botryotinia narcissicola]